VTAFSGIAIISDIIGHEDTKKNGLYADPDAAESRLSTLLFG
jgi:hypothetical protein